MLSPISTDASLQPADDRFDLAGNDGQQPVVHSSILGNMAEKVQGSVKWFSNKKGYGFITPAEGGTITEDVFVHQSSIFCEGYRTLVSSYVF